MKQVRLNGIELEYDVEGSGEPALLIGTGPIADSFMPFLSDDALADRYRLIRYHQRGQAGRMNGGEPVSFADHAGDAAALLRHLGIRRAHVAGHSSGAIIALQLAADVPELVQSLALLEPPLIGVASAGAFFDKTGPALSAYGAGDREGAMAKFLSVVSSLDWETCRTILDERVPGGVAQVMTEADALFGSYLPALSEWRFGSEQAAAMSQPVLSVVGTASEPLFTESHDLLCSWFPQIEACTIDGVAHLLHLQKCGPVARAVAEFFARWPIAIS